MKTVYCRMASTPLNYIIPYFAKISTQNHINNLQNLICILLNLLSNQNITKKLCILKFKLCCLPNSKFIIL